VRSLQPLGGELPNLISDTRVACVRFGAMPRKESDDATELLRDLLIVQLGLAGVGRDSIRKIARCDNNRVAAVLSLLRKGKKHS